MATTIERRATDTAVTLGELARAKVYVTRHEDPLEPGAPVYGIYASLPGDRLCWLESAVTEAEAYRRACEVYAPTLRALGRATVCDLGDPEAPTAIPGLVFLGVVDARGYKAVPARG